MRFEFCALCFNAGVVQPYRHGDIIQAARNGDVKELDRCIDLGANIDEQSRRGEWTPLMAAASGDHLAAVEFLIAHKANVNARSSLGFFPLYHAAGATKHTFQICEAQLKAGAKKHAKAHKKTTAEWAEWGGRKELAAFIESWPRAPHSTPLLQDAVQIVAEFEQQELGEAELRARLEGAEKKRKIAEQQLQQQRSENTRLKSQIKAMEVAHASAQCHAQAQVEFLTAALSNEQTARMHEADAYREALRKANMEVLLSGACRCLLSYR